MADKRTGAAAGGALALALGLIAILEGYGPQVRPGVYASYVDVAGVVTICNGHTGTDVKLGQTVARAICDDIANKDLSAAFTIEDRYIRRPEELEPWVRAAAALFIINVGEGGFSQSSFLRLLNQRKITDACNAMLLWNKARAGPQGALVVVRGLVNRRQAERRLCLGDLP